MFGIGSECIPLFSLRCTHRQQPVSIPIRRGTKMTTTPEISATRHFVERALIDFALDEAVRKRPPSEQMQWLTWIASAPGEKAEEYRVSLLLDALAHEQ